MRFLVLAMLLGTSGQPSDLSPIFDNATARELMQLRRQFDEAELAAIREFDAVMGTAAIRIAIPTGHYRNQLATGDMGNYRWTPEQKRRAARAWSIRQKRIDEAEALLSAGTTLLLKPFGYKEDRLPPTRRRKWDGPSVHGFNALAGSVPPESRALLQEVRRLWSLSARQPH